jgi:MFS family permease
MAPRRPPLRPPQPQRTLVTRVVILSAAKDLSSLAQPLTGIFANRSQRRGQRQKQSGSGYPVLASRDRFGVVSRSMEHANPPRKALFIFVWGVLGWGFSTALAITLFDWYTTRHIETYNRIVGRFLIFVALGAVWGLRIWNRRDELGRKKLTRAASITQLVLFIGLMLGLAFALWAMAHH